MNANQIIYTQFGLGVALATALFLFFYLKTFRTRDKFRLAKASSSATVILGLVWGFFLCGVFEGSLAETFAAAFSQDSASAERWGTVGLFRVLSVAFGASLLPWVVALIVLFIASGGFV